MACRSSLLFALIIGAAICTTKGICFANDDTLSLSENGSEQLIDFREMVETVPYTTTIPFCNSSQNEIIGPEVAVSCGCVKIIGNLPARLMPGESATVKVAINPSKGNFSQEMVVWGVVAGDRKQLARVILSGNVLPLVKITPSRISRDELRAGAFLFNLHLPSSQFALEADSLKMKLQDGREVELRPTHNGMFAHLPPGSESQEKDSNLDRVIVTARLSGKLLGSDGESISREIQHTIEIINEPAFALMPSIGLWKNSDEGVSMKLVLKDDLGFREETSLSPIQVLIELEDGQIILADERQFTSHFRDVGAFRKILTIKGHAKVAGEVKTIKIKYGDRMSSSVRVVPRS